MSEWIHFFAAAGRIVLEPNIRWRPYFMSLGCNSFAFAEEDRCRDPTSVPMNGLCASEILGCRPDLGGLPAVDGHQGSGDERCVIGGQKQRRRGKLRRLGQPTHRQ